MGDYRNFQGTTASKKHVSRLIGDLINEGYMKKVGKKYWLGLSILNLSGVIMSQLEIHRKLLNP